MPHSYEEIRSVALDIISERERVSYPPNQYEHLSLGIGEVFARRAGHDVPQYDQRRPDEADRQLFLEIFWDLFRQGIISLGLDDSNRQFPFFHVTRLGKELAKGNSPYFFHDVSSYETAIRREVPDIDDVSLLYLKEAMQAFRAGCMLSATVMLGVASENIFETVLDIAAESDIHKARFAPILKERSVLKRFNRFRAALDAIEQDLSSEVREDLDTHLSGILSVIRTFRNESGHPTGKIIDREQTYVLLQLFVSYCKKQFQLKNFFEAKE